MWISMVKYLTKGFKVVVTCVDTLLIEFFYAYITLIFYQPEL